MKHSIKKPVAGTALALGALGALPPIRSRSVPCSVTGPAAFLGDPELKTLQLYVDDLNKKGGVLGRPLQLVHYDDGSDANKANGFAKRLIEDDKVDVLVGGTTTGATMSWCRWPRRWAFRSSRWPVPWSCRAGQEVGVQDPHTDRMAAEKVFEDMKKRGLTKVALLSETSGFGASGKRNRGVAGKYGITLVANETYGPKDTDMSPQLTKIKTRRAFRPCSCSVWARGRAIVTKNYKQLGITLPLYQSHGVASDEFLKLAGPAAEGVRLPSPAQLIPRSCRPATRRSRSSPPTTKACKAAYKTDVSTFGGYAYDGLMLAVDAIKRAGSTDKAKVRDARSDQGASSAPAAPSTCRRPTTWASTCRPSVCSK